MVDYARAAAEATEPLACMEWVQRQIGQARECTDADEALHLLACVHGDLNMVLDDRSGRLDAHRQLLDDLHGQVAALVRLGSTSPGQIASALAKAERIVSGLKG